MNPYFCITKNNQMSSTPSPQAIVTQVRRDILRMVHKVNSGHPGGSLGCAEFFVCLYNEILELNEGFTMDGINEDLFLPFQRPYFTCFLQCPCTSRIFPCGRAQHLPPN